MPTKVLDLELSQELEPVWGVEGYEDLSALARYHGRPLGWIHIPVRQRVVSVERLREGIVGQLNLELVRAVIGKQFGGGAANSVPLVPISVVVCTRDRTEQLERCLQALLTLDYPDYEIIVVDNAPCNDDTARLAARLPVRYVREERAGSGWARNRGITEARYEIVAFTDDDARPDRSWLQAIARAFAEPGVMAVTGLVAPAELETTAQICFEDSYGMGRELRRRTIRRNGLKNWKLLSARDFGAGPNMAFRCKLFDEIGPFDVALGVGTPSGGGGDIEMFHRLVAQGYTLVYEPAALVWQTGQRGFASLRRLLYNNGRSFGAYLLTCARNGTVSRRSILRFAVRHWLGRWFLRRLSRPGKFPRRLVAIELAGALLSPLAYRAAQAHAKQITAAHQGLEARQYTSQETLP